MGLVFLRTDRIAPCLFVMFDIFNINFFKKYSYIYIITPLYEHTYVHPIPINFDHLYYSKYIYIYVKTICKLLPRPKIGARSSAFNSSALLGLAYALVGTTFFQHTFLGSLLFY
jgi:hypothetical protein